MCVFTNCLVEALLYFGNLQCLPAEYVLFYFMQFPKLSKGLLGGIDFNPGNMYYM